jgi:hypothetical protein
MKGKYNNVLELGLYDNGRTYGRYRVREKTQNMKTFDVLNLQELL